MENMENNLYEALTASETLVMKCIWDAEREVSLADIFEMVNSQYNKEWKYQTVSTFLAKLVQKGFISPRREGHRVIYEILISENDYKADQAKQFINFWNRGSVRQFLTAFYKERKITKEELEELKKTIEELDN